MGNAPGFVEVISILIAFDASLSGMMKALMNLDANLIDRSCPPYSLGRANYCYFSHFIFAEIDLSKRLI